MAKGPGPLIAIAGALALYFMSRRGSSGGTGTGNLDETIGGGDGDGDGGVFGGGTSGDDYSGPIGGGGGGGGGGKTVPGKYTPPKAIAPTDMWISPDCSVVAEGSEWFGLFKANFMTVVATLKAEIDTHSTSGAANETSGDVSLASFTIPDEFTVAAMAFGIADYQWKDGVGIDVVYADVTKLPQPLKCLAKFPPFDKAVVALGDGKEWSDFLKILHGKIDTYASSYNGAYGFLYSLFGRLASDPAVQGASMNTFTVQVLKRLPAFRFDRAEGFVTYSKPGTISFTGTSSFAGFKGTIKDKSGAPIKGASVDILPPSRPRITTSTSDSGAFTIQEPPIKGGSTWIQITVGDATWSFVMPIGANQVGNGVTVNINLHFDATGVVSA